MTILDEIAENTRERVAKAKRKISFDDMKRMAYKLPKGHFEFERALKAPGITFICECKKASPSKGLIAPDFPYLQIAKEYEEAGAGCISVLTEPKWFLGSDDYLREIADTVNIPCIRKDFTVDSYMIYEAKVLGAKAVLLICSILDEETIKKYIEICDELGLSALVETHSDEEVQMALRCNARIIGVNNRNLKNFTVDTENSRKLRKLIPSDVIFVSESGVSGPEDIQTLREIGADAVLVGEALMRAEDKKAKLAELKGRPKVKLCGLMTKEDIETANELKPDYVGFIYANKGHRKKTPEEASELKKYLDPSIKAVGVFLDQEIDFVADAAKSGVIDLIQLHGNEDEEYIKALKEKVDTPVIKAFCVRGEDEMKKANGSVADYVLFDSFDAGSGNTFDWELLKLAKKPYFLSGGLTPYNLEGAIKMLHPYGVDVSSGIETDKKKDPVKMKLFMEEVEKAVE
ncbi:MAG: indole-3-glycerol phosphate synthase TrpC [Lachnospiraceae bacterium]|nr:indole-3-glycerol phosphate synthase TrpC [Lachnospiraceae bacterium]